MATQVTIVAGNVDDAAVEWLKAHGAKVEGVGLLTIQLPEKALVHKGNRGWDYSLSFYNAEGNDEESYIDVELSIDAWETSLTLKYEGDRDCTCKGRGCPECNEELAAIRRGEDPYAHHRSAARARKPRVVEYAPEDLRAEEQDASRMRERDEASAAEALRRFYAEREEERRSEQE